MLAVTVVDADSGCLENAGKLTIRNSSLRSNSGIERCQVDGIGGWRRRARMTSRTKVSTTRGIGSAVIALNHRHACFVGSVDSSQVGW